MTFARYKIPLILLSIIGISKAAVGVISKAPVYESLGGFALPLLTMFESIVGLWFVLLPIALLMMFYGQSFNIELVLPVLVVLIVIFKALETWYKNMPSIP